LRKKVVSSELSRIVKTEKKPALVLFYGDWCIDCRNFKPTWDKWCEGKPGSILMIEVQRGGPEWEHWNLDEIPTVAAFAKGCEIDRVNGSISASDLAALLDKFSCD